MIRHSIIRRQISDDEEESITTLECLPNEILVDVFSHFNGLELLNQFYGLNCRLNNVLHDSFLYINLRLNSISKAKFDRICQKQIPYMGHRISNLQISNSEDTPLQIELFLCYKFSFEQFIHLKVLTLTHITSYRTLTDIVEECFKLEILEELHLLSCYIQRNGVDSQGIIDRIWSLPSLVSCTIGIRLEGEHTFSTPTRFSPELRNVVMQESLLRLHQIEEFNAHTPKLKKLAVNVSTFIEANYKSNGLSNLIELSISSPFMCDGSRMEILLENTNNLESLNIDLSNDLIDGNLWQTMIQNNLPKLRSLRLRMKTTIPDTEVVETYAERLIESFRTPFWIDDHQWFVQCLVWNRTIYLQTVPNEYDGQYPVSLKTTYVGHKVLDPYKNVKKIFSPTFFGEQLPTNTELTKVTHLTVNLPIEPVFWSVVKNFSCLQSIEICYHSDNFQSQVQNLLDKAGSLTTLTLRQQRSTSIPKSLFRYRHSSISILDIREINVSFNESNCIQLAKCPLGQRCEKLSIFVESPSNIISLIDHFTSLRILCVKCKEENSILKSLDRGSHDIQRRSENNTKTDFCLEWLRTKLPTAVVIRDPKQSKSFLIWK